MNAATEALGLTAVRTLTVRAGDSIVVTCAGILSDLQRERLTGAVRSVIGEPDIKTLILDGGMDVAVLRREDGGGQTSAPQIGDTIPFAPGYIYAGVMRGEDGAPDYHLAVLTGAAAAKIKGTWGEYGKRVEGADHRRDGLANTQAMAGAGSTAAKKALAAGAYIASQGEAHLIAANLHDLMPTGWHWTSTQLSPSSAWVQDFEYGRSYFSFKDCELRAVAVRRFNPSDFGPSEVPA